MKILLVSLLAYVFLSYYVWMTAPEDQNLIHSSTPKWRWGLEKQPQEHHHSGLILLDFFHYSPTLCKNYKKSKVYKKIRTCETLTLTKSFVFLSQLKTVCILFINWSEHFIPMGWFQICSGNKKELLYACEVNNLVSKGVISQYVQEWSGKLLQFNILSLYCIRHYCA